MVAFHVLPIVGHLQDRVSFRAQCGTTPFTGQGPHGAIAGHGVVHTTYYHSTVVDGPARTGCSMQSMICALGLLNAGLGLCCPCWRLTNMMCFQNTKLVCAPSVSEMGTDTITICRG